MRMDNMFDTPTTTSLMEKSTLLTMQTDAEGTDPWDVADATTSPYLGDEEDEVQKLAPITGVSQILIGILIICGNTVVLIVLRRISTLAKLTRFLLGNLAVADCIFGITCIARGILSMNVQINPARYCPHLMGLLVIGVTYTYGTTAVISGHMVYLVAKGATYDKVWTNKVVMVAISLAILVACGTYPLVFLFVEESYSYQCSATSGHVHPHFFGIIDVTAMIFILFSLVCQVLTAGFLRQKLRRIGIANSKRLIKRMSARVQTVSTTTTTKHFKKTVTLTRHNSTETTTTVVSGFITAKTIVGVLEPRIATKLFNIKESVEMDSASNSCPGDAIKRKAYQPGHRGAMMARIKRERHTFKIIATISVCLFLCTTPPLIVQFINAFIPSIYIHKDLPAGLMTFALLNSLMNVLIYIMRDASFRKSVGDLIRCVPHVSNAVGPSVT